MADRRIILELDTVLLGNTIVLTQGGKEFGLFDRINAEVGFHIQVNIQHIFGVTRLFAYHFDHFFGHAGFVQHHGRSRRRGRFCHRGRRYRRLGDRRGCSGRRFARVRKHKFNAVADRRIILELDTVLLGNTIVLTQGGKEFGLFDRINAEVGFHIQVNIQHIFGVTRLFAYHFDHFFGHAGFVQRHGRSSRYRRGLSYRSRCSRRGRCLGVVRVNRVYLVHKRLGTFHH